METKKGKIILLFIKKLLRYDYLEELGNFNKTKIKQKIKRKINLIILS